MASRFHRKVTMNDNRFYSTLAALAIIFLALRVVFYNQLLDSPVLALPVLDSDWYYRWAASLAKGYGHPEGAFWLGPGYPVALAAMFKALGSIELKLIPIAQFLLSTGTLILLALTVRKHLGDFVALLTAGIALLYAPWMYYDGMVLSASWILFLNAALLYLLLSHTSLVEGNTTNRNKEFAVWAGAGLVCGLSAVARPSILIFAVFLMGVILIRRERAAYFLKLGLFLLMIVMAHVPVLVRNLEVQGSSAFVTSSGGINFYIGNRSGASGKYDEAPWIRSFDPVREAEGYRVEASRRSGEELTLDEANRFWMGQALREIFRYKSEWLQLLGKKLWMTFRAEEIPNNFSFAGARSYIPILNVLPLGWGLLLPFAAAGALLLWISQRRLWVLWLYIAGYVATNLIFFTSSEYRFPLLLVLFPLAAYFLVRIWQLLEAKQWVKVSGAVLVYFLFLLVANWPSKEFSTYVQPRMDMRNLGSMASLRGLHAEAMGFYARALAMDARDNIARVGLADAMWELGSYDEARIEYEKAGIEPPSKLLGTPVDKLLWKVQRQVSEGDTLGAIAQIETVFPDNETAPAPVLAAKGKLLFMQGEYVRATEMMLRAHEKDPISPEWLYYAGDYILETDDAFAADSLYSAALLRYPAFAPARIARAFLGVETGDIDVARHELGELLKIQIAEDSVQAQVDSLAKLLDKFQR